MIVSRGFSRRAFSHVQKISPISLLGSVSNDRLLKDVDSSILLIFTGWVFVFVALFSTFHVGRNKMMPYDTTFDCLIEEKNRSTKDLFKMDCMVQYVHLDSRLHVVVGCNMALQRYTRSAAAFPSCMLGSLAALHYALQSSNDIC